MARLTIPDEPTSATFTPSSAQSAFAITFALFEKADLSVTVDGVELLQSEFSFTGTELDGGGYDGGTVTLNTATSGVVTISRNVTAVRNTNFAPAQSVPPRAIDAALNRLTAIAQDHDRRIAEAGTGGGGEGGGGGPVAISDVTGLTPALAGKLGLTQAQYSIGPFPASAPSIPNDITRVTTVSYAAGAVVRKLSGAATYVYDTDVNSAYVSAHPRASFLSADGRGWRLDELEPTPEMFGAVVDGSTNDHTALNAWIQWCADKGRLGVISGFARCNSSITVSSKSLALEGASPQTSGLIFGASAGLIYQGGTPVRQASPTIRLRSMALRAATAGNGTALDISYTNGEGSTSPTVGLHEVVVSGVSGVTNWTTGVKLNNARNVIISDCTFEGAVDTVGGYPWSGTIGLDVTGANSPVEIKLRNTNFYGFERGIRLRGLLEGIYFHQITMVAVDIGIDDDVSGGGTAGEPLFFLTDSHLNVYTTAYKGRNRLQARIAGNLFYAQFGAAAVVLDIVNNASAYANFLVQDNVFFRIPPGTGTPTATAISIGGTGSGERMRIEGNVFDGSSPWTVAIHLLSSANGVKVGRNEYVNATVEVDDDGIGNTLETTGGGLNVTRGTGSPEGVVTANRGDIYVQTDGDVGSTLWEKRTDGTNTSWGTLGSQPTRSLIAKAGIVLDTGQTLVGRTNSTTARNIANYQSDGTMLFGDLNAGQIATFNHFVPDGTAFLKNLGSATNRWATVFLINNPNVSSDERLKRDIVPIDPGAMLDAVEAVSFNWREGDTQRHYGWIAQDVLAATEAAGLPDIVQEDETLSLDPTAMCAVLWNEVRALRRRIGVLERVEAEVEALRKPSN
jgi:hypothetical protein